MFLVGLSLVLRLICFGFGLEGRFQVKRGEKYTIPVVSSTPLCVGEGWFAYGNLKPNFSQSWSRLGEGSLLLGKREPEIPFSFLSFVNSRNHSLD